MSVDNLPLSLGPLCFNCISDLCLTQESMVLAQSLCLSYSRQFLMEKYHQRLRHVLCVIMCQVAQLHGAKCMKMIYNVDFHYFSFFWSEIAHFRFFCLNLAQKKSAL